MGGLGVQERLTILVIALLFCGGKKRFCRNFPLRPLEV